MFALRTGALTQFYKEMIEAPISCNSWRLSNLATRNYFVLNFCIIFNFPANDTKTTFFEADRHIFLKRLFALIAV